MNEQAFKIFKDTCESIKTANIDYFIKSVSLNKMLITFEYYSDVIFYRIFEYGRTNFIAYIIENCENLGLTHINIKNRWLIKALQQQHLSFLSTELNKNGRLKLNSYWTLKEEEENAKFLKGLITSRNTKALEFVFISRLVPSLDYCKVWQSFVKLDYSLRVDMMDNGMDDFFFKIISDDIAKNYIQGIRNDNFMELI